LRQGANFPSFKDYYNQQPYLFFSCNNTKNGYTQGYAIGGVQAYFAPTNPVQYYNPDSFQILCAGWDGVFGPGGSWTGQTASQIAAPGQDDLTNFAQLKMGVTQ
jgi:hypothetical protein